MTSVLYKGIQLCFLTFQTVDQAEDNCRSVICRAGIPWTRNSRPTSSQMNIESGPPVMLDFKY